ncbi:type I DNA topoisomerase [Patescibacteria group bacterium]
MKNLVIVESPTKAKTIKKFLGRDYTVLSSYGHIRDLPKKTMGVDTKGDFELEYEIPEKAKKHVTALKKAAKDAETIYFATDEDREGEAIAWHLMAILKPKKSQAKRIVFHEITKKAIQAALENPRDIDEKQVDAQQARRALDRLVGYELSPLLWEKIRRGLSAGRVQSVAVRMIVDRENDIRKFKPEEYWSIEADLKKEKDEFRTKLIKQDDKQIGKMGIKKEADAKKIVKDLEKADYIVSEVKKKEKKKSPAPPFKTSTLQQAAANQLRFSAKQTMMFAQQLYEGIDMGSKGSKGLITYMRTDSLNLSKEALDSTGDFIVEKYGDKYYYGKPRVYKTKSKGAQEAHEAIRPTDVKITPEDAKQYLDDRQFKLYKLIWQRMVASQMAPAIFDATTVDVKADKYLLRANGSIIKFDGYMKVAPSNAKETLLPKLVKDDKLDLTKLHSDQHFTEPPARYNEASLVKALEAEGIGRPSTYAPTISTIQARDYVNKNDDRRFAPTETGELVNKVMVEHFPRIVDLKFTAEMEEELDEIAQGKREWNPVIKDFYKPFKANLDKKFKQLSKKELTEEKTSEKCDKCQSEMVIKMGRFGKFMACTKYPECKNTKPLPEEEAKQKELEKEHADVKCPKCKGPMQVRRGRFGEFLGCSKYPDCKGILPIEKKTGAKCPQCKKGDIIEKQSKKGRTFYACNKYPKCKFALWQKPTSEKCPDCKSLLVFAAGKKIACSSKECKFEKAQEE